MIDHLTGRVVGKGPAYASIDVGGVGFRLPMSTGSLAALPAEGDEVTVYTHLYVREDELTLFGFESEAERDLFELLITVSGVGPKVALSALSALAPHALADAIATDDVAVISSVPGIGKKTAERLCVELRDKLGSGERLAGGARSERTGASAALLEANDALVAMGFSAAETSTALKGAPDTGVQAAITYALKRLGGGS